MKRDPSDLDPQKLWQSQEAERTAMTLADIHAKSRRFQSRIRRRNLIEYAGCVLVILGFFPTLFMHAGWMIQAAGALMIVATVFVAWQLHRRASARTAPATAESLIDFHRTELIRQRDAVRSVALWYLAPFVPGMTLLLLGRWFQAPAPNRSPEADHLLILAIAAFAIVVFLAIWLLNGRGAVRLQRQIDELTPPPS